MRQKGRSISGGWLQGGSGAAQWVVGDASPLQVGSWMQLRLAWLLTACGLTVEGEAGI